MPRVLRTDVHVAGRVFAAGTTPPDEYARRITFPAAWQDDDMTRPSNDNDTSQIGENTRVVSLVPTGITEGPAPRPSVSGRGVDADVDAGEPALPAAEVQNPEKVLDAGEHAAEAPPRSGKGSGTEAWDSYARSHGVAVTEGADRAEIIAACENAGLIPPA